MNKCTERLMNGLVKENPTFVLMLGMCPTLAVTTSAINGIGMGLSTTAVLIMSNMMISMLRKIIPDSVRMPAFIVIVASFVTIVDFLMEGFVPSLYDSLGLYIPLIVVNCIILGRAEAFASKHGVLDSALDGLGMGLGYTLAVTSMSLIREVLSTGMINLVNPFDETQVLFNIRILPDDYVISMFSSPVGAFVTFAILAALVSVYKNHAGQKVAAKEVK